MYKWPPKMEDLGDVVKKYIDDGNPLSISSDTGVYAELEEKFAKLHGRKYALAVSSGTMALFSAYFAVDIKPGDEIICTAFSFHATASPAQFWGADLIYCDVEADTGNIDVQQIEPLITDRAKAVVTNDQWGHPCDKDEILRICRKHGLKYIEDCSHAHFSKYKDKYVGSFGDVACWSFQGSKMINGGEGGILLTDDEKIYEKAVLLGHYSWRSINTVTTEVFKSINNTGFGLKLRMHPLAAVIILHELNHYAEGWIESRNETLTYFEQQLDVHTPIKPMAKREYMTSMGAWYGFYPRLDFIKLHINKEKFVEYLKKNNIEVKIPRDGILPYLPLLKEWSYPFENPQNHVADKRYWGAEQYIDSVIGFPAFSDHEYEEIDRYITVISDYFKLPGDGWKQK